MGRTGQFLQAAVISAAPACGVPAVMGAALPCKSDAVFPSEIAGPGAA